MEIKLPNSWDSYNTRTRDTYTLAKNHNGVVIGYNHLNVSSFSIWVGNDWEDNVRINANISSESEAKRECLKFMDEYPNVTYESSGISGKLLDGQQNRISPRSP